MQSATSAASNERPDKPGDRGRFAHFLAVIGHRDNRKLPFQQFCDDLRDSAGNLRIIVGNGGATLGAVILCRREEHHVGHFDFMATIGLAEAARIAVAL